jgi:hypothetical protein
VLIITQELPQWTQMLKFGKEPLSMMVKFMDIKKAIMMKMIFKNMVMTKKLKLTLDYHMYLL